MAPTRNKKKSTGPNLSLDDLIAKKRKEDASALASTIMGRGRTVSAKSNRNTRSASARPTPTGPAADRRHHDLHKPNTLASRIGKTKTPTKKSKSLPSSPALPTLPPSAAKKLQDNKLFAALHTQANIRNPGQQQTQNNSNKAPASAPKGPKNAGVGRGTGARTGGGNEFSIRGAAGPAVLQASNFAPGTTGEDIKHAMQPLGEIMSCLVLTAAPTVIAEIVFREKEAADRCIRQYDGQRADGRVLHISYKAGPPVARIQAVPYGQESEDPWKAREEADRARRERNVHYQDGTYGVQPPVYSAPLYSDALLQKGRGFSGR